MTDGQRRKLIAYHQYRLDGEPRVRAIRAAMYLGPLQESAHEAERDLLRQLEYLRGLEGQVEAAIESQRFANSVTRDIEAL